MNPEYITGSINPEHYRIHKFQILPDSVIRNVKKALRKQESMTKTNVKIRNK